MQIMHHNAILRMRNKRTRMQETVLLAIHKLFCGSLVRAHNLSNRSLSAISNKPFLHLSEIKLLSWTLSVNTTKTSANLLWSRFPLNDSIDRFAVKYTEAETGVSVFLPLESHHMDTGSFHIDRRLRPSRVYTFQIVAYTGSMANDTYSSQNVSLPTKEGGKI